MPNSYSYKSPMATRPYAIGERPGGNYIPTIPLLSGTDAWDSLSSYYDPRFKALEYNTRNAGPRQRRDFLNKAATLLKLAKIPGQPGAASTTGAGASSSPQLAAPGTPSGAGTPSPAPKPPIPPQATTSPAASQFFPPGQPNKTQMTKFPFAQPGQAGYGQMQQGTLNTTTSGGTAWTADNAGQFVGGAQAQPPAVAAKPQPTQQPAVAAKPQPVPPMAANNPESQLKGAFGKIMSFFPKMQDVGPEGEQAVVQATTQLQDVADKAGPEEIKRLGANVTSNDPKNPVVQKTVNNIAGQMDTDPKTAWEIFQGMDDGAKIMAGMGIALGTISLLSAMTGEGNGLMGFLGALLGFGTAAGTLAHGGVFGEGAQQATQGLLGAVGLHPGGKKPPWEPPPALNTATKPIVEATGTPEQMTLDGPAIAQKPQTSTLSPANMLGLAKRHNLPMGLGDPNAFDEPDQAAMVKNFIRSGKHQPAIEEIASQLSDQEREMLRTRMQEQIAAMPKYERFFFDRDTDMQNRYKWLNNL